MSNIVPNCKGIMNIEIIKNAHLIIRDVIEATTVLVFYLKYVPLHRDEDWRVK